WIMIFSRYSLFLLVTLGLLSGCVQQPQLIDRGDYFAQVVPNNPGQDNRVKFLVMHYTAVDDKESLKT
ncbi:N-acetylmuramoyl-L-alanine amidase, partial [Proteus mirabilis]